MYKSPPVLARADRHPAQSGAASMWRTRVLKERYEAGGGQITVKLIPGEGHKVSPSFFECRELVDFVLNQVPAVSVK